MSNAVNTSWKHKAFMLTLISLVSVALVFSVISKRDSRVLDLKVHFNKNYGKSLIAKKELIGMLGQHIGYDVVGSKISELPFGTLEGFLEKDSRIHNAEIYIDKLNRVAIVIDLSEPIVRVNPKEGKGFYLDQFGNKIKLNKNSTVRVPVATGYVEGYKEGFAVSDKKTNLYHVYDLAKRLYDDPQFLSPLVEQIYVDENNDITLIPKVGREKIFFGKFDNVDNKFYRLSEFYRRGLPKLGWNKYKELRLDTKDQVKGVKHNYN